MDGTTYETAGQKPPADAGLPAIRRRYLVSLIALIGFVGITLVASRPAHAGGVVIHVDTTADDNTVNGNCTLREAIMAANANHTVDGCLDEFGDPIDTIDSGLGAGTPFINITSPLPHITEPVSLFGQFGGSDRIEIHGPGGPASSGFNGLTIEETAAGTKVSSFVVDNFPDDGILILADEVTILDTFVGTDASGSIPSPNLGFGIHIRGNGDRIGSTIGAGPCVEDWCGRNIISGNLHANLMLDTDSSGALVWGNFIGVKRNGAEGLSTDLAVGILDRGQANTIGGVEGIHLGADCLGECNLISGNNGDAGVYIDTMAANTRVWGNYIGTDLTGTLGISNGHTNTSVGILALGSPVTIGGATPEMRNVVSGNTGAEIQVRGTGSIVQGNYIGTNAAGDAAVPGSGQGISVYLANDVLIGGGAVGAGNVISGASVNFAHGIVIQQSTNTKIFSNFIGTQADGVTELGNGGEGIYIYVQSQFARVFSNTIAYNTIGVYMDGSSPPVNGNTLTANSIYSNSSGGITLISANDGVAPPTITAVHPIQGTACAMCLVDLFDDDANQGRYYEATTQADAQGNFSVESALHGPNLTATATDTAGNTSQFSQPFSLPALPFKQGDVNCDDNVDEFDFDFLIRYAAGLNDGTTPGANCPDVGAAVPAAPPAYPWGDLNCDGLVNAVDALYLISYLADLQALPAPLPQGCIPIGFKV